MTALRRQIKDILLKTVTLDDEIRGSTFDQQMFEGFKDKQAEKLRGQYVRLNMFQEAWIPAIKAGSYTEFELFDLTADESPTAGANRSAMGGEATTRSRH